MNSVKLFLLGCIPMRILMAYVTKTSQGKRLKHIGYILLLISLSFLWLYFTKSRLNAVEAGGKTWWAPFRLIHGVLYLASSIYAIKMKTIAWIPLAIDVLLGSVLFYNHRFKKLP